MNAPHLDRTFAFVDLSGFTALTEAHGDTEAVATLARFRQLGRDALGPGDVLVKTVGDEAMLAFEHPGAAVAALRRLYEAALDDESLPLLRGGAHHGPAVVDGDDFFGASVNLAARVAGHAQAGQLLVTTAVAFAARDAGEVVTHLGTVRLRNIAEPVDLYEIELDPHPDTAVDPVCAMKVPTTGPAAIRLHHAGRDVWFCGLPCVARYAAAPDRYVTSAPGTA
jgi:adenylate cyclase